MVGGVLEIEKNPIYLCHTKRSRFRGSYHQVSSYDSGISFLIIYPRECGTKAGCKTSS